MKEEGKMPAQNRMVVNEEEERKDGSDGRMRVRYQRERDERREESFFALYMCVTFRLSPFSFPTVCLLQKEVSRVRERMGKEGKQEKGKRELLPVHLAKAGKRGGGDAYAIYELIVGV